MPTAPHDAQPSFYWHDYETWGVNPLVDRPAQFAGIRTDASFNPIGRPLNVYAQPTPDFLPHPEACLITGITPQLALQQGTHEAHFAQLIEAEFSQPNTTVIGYNNIAFDDEVTRALFYRNFYDPYQHTWQHNNSRWDLINVVRACYALRPDGIVWPQHDDGRVSMKLEHLTQANGIDHGQAHDAMSDVYATIGIAKLIATKQPKLWNFAFGIRKKAAVNDLFVWHRPEPLVHVSGFYGADKRFLSLLQPVAYHPQQKAQVIAWDLRHDPQQFQNLTAEQLAEQTFQRRSPENPGTGLTTVHTGRCPFLAPQKTLGAESAQAANIDVAECQRRAQWLFNNPQFKELLIACFELPRDMEQPSDVDQQLYSGFFSEQDKQNMQIIRQAAPEQLAALQLNSDDSRLPQLLFRYRARNFPATLNDTELARWQGFCRDRLEHPPRGALSAQDFVLALENLAERHQNDGQKMALLKSLYDYAAQL